MAEIHVISLFKSKSLSAGDTGTSQVIDLRNLAVAGEFALALNSIAGTAGTAGTTTLSYVCSAFRDGSYVTPVGGYDIGTCGTGSGNPILAAFVPAAISPFMKVIATQTGAGTVGYDSKITAELIVK
jgi:hypothetical protein